MGDLLSKRVILVTGKGGVGRTTLSAALALAAAKAGKRVLLTEIGTPGGDYSPLARLFGRETFAANPEPLRDGVHGAFLWSRQGHEAFLHSVLPVGPLVRAAMGSKPLNRLLDAAPSFNEMGVFYHMIALLRERMPDRKSPTHELVVVDMPATGHALALVNLPEILLKLMPKGPIADACREGQGYLNDPAKCAACVVTIPEALPVTESIELVEGLRASGIAVGPTFMNKWVEDEFAPAERAELARALEGGAYYGAGRFRSVARAGEEAERLARGTRAPVVRVPELPAEGDALIAGLVSDLTRRNVL